MIKVLNCCIDSADWVKSITGYRPNNDVITLKELDEIAHDPQKNGGPDGLPNHWDYPLGEIPDLMCDNYDGTTFVVVRFKSKIGYEYRICEI